MTYLYKNRGLWEVLVPIKAPKALCWEGIHVLALLSESCVQKKSLQSKVRTKFT